MKEFLNTSSTTRHATTSYTNEGIEEEEVMGVANASTLSSDSFHSTQGRIIEREVAVDNIVGRPQHDETELTSSTENVLGDGTKPDVTEDFKRNFTGRQWSCLILLGLGNLFVAMVASLQAPFYPAEAERKGATASEYGLVFGLHELTVFLSSPLYGKYINRISPKVLCTTGIFTNSISCIAFGFLHKIDDHTWFITLSFVLRIVEALGASAFTTSSFAIIACEFPNSVATTFASLETFFGLGLILEPSVGGGLFEVGGYILPFGFTGGCLLLIGIMAWIIMPQIETIYEPGSGNEVTKRYGVCSILRIPEVAIAAGALFVAMNSVGFLSATMEPHLRQFDLSPLQIGLMFIINGGVYAGTAPIVGWICDRTTKPIYVILIGAGLIWVAFLFIGPAHFVPIDTRLWITGAGLVIMGFGVSSRMVPAFISCLEEAKLHGFPDNLSTYGVVSGLWTSSVCLGAFLGPSVGGFLYDYMTFRPATYYVLGTEGLIIVLIVMFLLAKRKLKSESCTKPVLIKPNKR